MRNSFSKKTGIISGLFFIILYFTIPIIHCDYKSYSFIPFDMIVGGYLAPHYKDGLKFIMVVFTIILMFNIGGFISFVFNKIFIGAILSGISCVLFSLLLIFLYTDLPNDKRILPQSFIFIFLSLVMGLSWKIHLLFDKNINSEKHDL